MFGKKLDKIKVMGFCKITSNCGSYQIPGKLSPVNLSHLCIFIYIYILLFFVWYTTYSYRHNHSTWFIWPLRCFGSTTGSSKNKLLSTLFLSSLPSEWPPVIPEVLKVLHLKWVSIQPQLSHDSFWSHVFCRKCCLPVGSMGLWYLPTFEWMTFYGFHVV